MRDRAGAYALHGLSCVQDFKREPGNKHPFERLACFLRSGEYEAAAIDAPFSIPMDFTGGSDHASLLQLVESIPLRGRPFPKGREFVEKVTGREPPLDPKKPLRVTEAYWKARGCNIRSALWTGARPGAPMAAACMALLAKAKRPIWRRDRPPQKGLLVEAFPAAQLRHWRLPHQQYDNGKKNATLKRRNRKTIADGISSRMGLGQLPQVVRKNPDALDAVICAFAAIAVTMGKVAVPPCAASEVEGWIAVHE